MAGLIAIRFETSAERVFSVEVFGWSWDHKVSLCAELERQGEDASGVFDGTVVRKALVAAANHCEKVAFWTRSVEVLPLLIFAGGVGAAITGVYMMAAYGVAYVVLGVAHIALGMVMTDIAYRMYQNQVCCTLSRAYKEVAEDARRLLGKIDSAWNQPNTKFELCTQKAAAEEKEGYKNYSGLFAPRQLSDWVFSFGFKFS